MKYLLVSATCYVLIFIILSNVAEEEFVSHVCIPFFMWFEKVSGQLPPVQ